MTCMKLPDPVNRDPAEPYPHGLHPRHGGEDEEKDDPGIDDVVNREDCRRNDEQQVYIIIIIIIIIMIIFVPRPCKYTLVKYDISFKDKGVLRFYSLRSAIQM